MSKDKETTETFNRIIHDVKVSNYDRRVGTKERDAYASYVREAYAAGYLDDEELGKRTDTVMRAKFASNLNEQVRDLPSYASLRGLEKVPVKVRKWALGAKVKAHKGYSFLALMVVSLLTAIMPSVVIGNTFASLHRPIVFPFDAIMVATIVLGAIGTFAGIIGMITVAEDGDNF